MERTPVSVAIAGIFSVIAFCVAASMLPHVVQVYKSKFWPQVKGTIISSSVQHQYSGKAEQYCPDVSYEYVAAGSSKIGNVIRQTDTQCSRYSRAPQAVADSYPVGKQVAVFYNPSDPDQAALQPGRMGGPIFGVLFVFALGKHCSFYCRSEGA